MSDVNAAEVKEARCGSARCAGCYEVEPGVFLHPPTNQRTEEEPAKEAAPEQQEITPKGYENWCLRRGLSTSDPKSKAMFKKWSES